MPEITLDDVTLHYEEAGTGAETVLFAHGLLFDRRIFEHQVAALSDRYRCIAFDFRGHGESEVTRSGYDMDTLAGDAAALIERFEAKPCHFVGLSMGGFVGLRLAVRRPELIRSLALLDTSAEPEPKENLARYRMLNLAARLFGLRAVTGHVLPIVFGRTTLAERPELARVWRERIDGQSRRGITRAVGGVVGRDGVADALGRVRAPTLVVVGDEDVATVPAKSERLRDGIPGARMVRIPRAGHMTSVEDPEAVTRELERFLVEVGGRRDDAPTEAE